MNSNCRWLAGAVIAVASLTLVLSGCSTDPNKGKKKYLESGQRFMQKGRYREAIERSLITLKALTFRPTGGIVAAATTSLPEAIGGVRNWDYRFCWLRDTTFTLLALANGGYFEEAVAWQDWLLRALAADQAPPRS